MKRRLNMNVFNRMSGFIKRLKPKSSLSHNSNTLFYVFETMETFPALKRTGDHYGHIYLLDTGNEVKIGWTKNIKKTIRDALKKKDVLKILITEGHTNYLMNRTVLHKTFNTGSNNRIAWTNASFTEVHEELSKLTFLDETSRLDQEERKRMQKLHEIGKQNLANYVS